MKRLSLITLFFCAIIFVSCSNMFEDLLNSKKNQYDIEYELYGGVWKEGYNAPSFYVEGNEIKLPASDSLAKEKFIFDGWFETNDFTGTAKTKIEKDEKGKKLFYAKWKPVSVSYSIKHFQQNICNDEYTEVPNDSEIKTGEAGTITNAIAKSYTGFVAQNITQSTIAADSSTVVNIYYNRIITTYTFNPNGGNWSGSTENQTVSGRYGATVSINSPSKQGFLFAGWNEPVPQTFGTESKNFTASWINSSLPHYTVKHFQQNITDNEYTEVSTDIEIKTGEAGALTNATAKNYTGFTAQSITQSAIAADGSTVVNIYYNRITTTYTFNPVGGNWNGVSENQTISGRYGAAVNITAPSKQGYIFAGWNDSVPQTFGTEAKIFTASWNTSNNTPYTVKHLQQNITDNEYTEVTSDTENKIGTTGSLTTATAKSYTGFTAQTFTQSEIEADGSTVINIYYDRITTTYTFNPNGGNWNGSTANQTRSGRYGATVTSPSNPVRSMFTFNSWNNTVPSVFGVENQTFNAKWISTPVSNITINGTTYDKTGEVYAIPALETGYFDGVVEAGSPQCNQGAFVQGRKVRLSSYIINKYVVTQELYEAVMTGNDANLNASPSFFTEAYPVSGEVQRLRPVDCVGWYEAIYFCNELTKKTLGESYQVYTINNITFTDGHISSANVTMDRTKGGYRLATEAEWEFAARGGDPTASDWNYTYSGHPSSLDSVGWGGGDNSHEVGLKNPNKLGTYDMSGNLWEWCWDIYDSNIKNNDSPDSNEIVINPANPTVSSTNRSQAVVRGGMLDFDDDHYTVWHRQNYTFRYSDYYNGLNTSYYDCSFRVVRTVVLE